jgi:hypothetical protein
MLKRSIDEVGDVEDHDDTKKQKVSEAVVEESPAGDVAVEGEAQVGGEAGGETKAKRLPKKKYALMCGYLGTGYKGLQMYVELFFFPFLSFPSEAGHILIHFHYTMME